MPPLKVKIKRDGRVVVVSVGGELDIASAPALTERAGRALQGPVDWLELDLAGLTFIDCAGARAVNALKKAAPPGCAVTVRGASRRICRVLAIVEAPLLASDVLEPSDGWGPSKVPEPAGSRAGEGAAWLRLEAEILVRWAEQARADSKKTVARARAAQGAAAFHRFLATAAGYSQCFIGPWASSGWSYSSCQFHQL